MSFKLSNVIKKLCSFKVVFCLSLFLFFAFSITGCFKPRDEDKPFNPAECMENIPQVVKGLEILEGPRTRQSIIFDMQPVVCSAQALFHKMCNEGKQIKDGRVIFRVVVEFNGEVINASVEESTVGSEEFARKVTGFILAHDFGVWNRDDVDAVFLYPVNFGK